MLNTRTVTNKFNKLPAYTLKCITRFYRVIPLFAVSFYTGLINK